MKKSFVKVQFQGSMTADGVWDYFGKEYEFGTYLKLEVGDIVVVNCSTGLQVARVSQVDTCGTSANKLVVCKVDLKQHEEFVQKEKARAALEAKMKARLEECVKLETYKKVAETDPEMKALVAEFESLDSEEE